MGILLRKSVLAVLILGLAVLPGAFGVEQRDYEEAQKEDEPAESLQQSERSTEYPNGVNVIPGSADIHYPTYDKIPKSAFSCAGRIPGFYADPELRCQVWHICDESGVQQSFLCTNGTIFSQEKRTCDWWYNVNCDPEEVARNYEANNELYKELPPKNEDEAIRNNNNDLPPPPQKKPVQQQQQHRPQPQQSHRPQNHDQQSQQHQQHQQSNQRNYEHQPQQSQHQNHQQQPRHQQQQQEIDAKRAAALKVIQDFERSQQSEQSRPQQNQNYDNQERAAALKILENYEQSQSQSQYRPQNNNYETPQARRQPPANNNYVAPTASSTQSNNQSPTTPSGSAPEKKRVIVLRLPGPLPPGATIPPHILMEYAESVLAAEREGKAPPAGLVSSKTVQLNNNAQQQQRPHQQNHNHQQRSHQPQQQQQHNRPQPVEVTSTTTAPQRVRPSPKGPTLSYTPRPFSQFLEAAVKLNGQQHRQSSPAPPQQQNRRYEEPRPQQQQNNNNYEQQQPQQRRLQQQQQQPSYQESREQEQPQTQAPPRQQQQPQQQKKTPVAVQQQQQYSKPSKSSPSSHHSASSDTKKFRHSTPRKHGQVNFAPKPVNEDLEDHVEESRRPAYFNNLAPVPHLSQNFYQTQPPQHQQPTIKTDVHLKSSFEQVEKVTRPQRVKQQYQEPITTTTTTERYLTAEEIQEPAIKRLVVAAGLKIKDPRNKQLTTPATRKVQGSSEEDNSEERNYEPVRVIVARKQITTTTYAPETYPTTTSAPKQKHQRQRHQQQKQQPIIQREQTETIPSSTPTPTPPQRVRPVPKGPALPYTPRPFSAFLEAAVKYNGQKVGTSSSTTVSPPPKVEQTPEQVYTEETKNPPRTVMRRVIRKKIRTNPDQTTEVINTEVVSSEQIQPETQTFQKIQKNTRRPTTTTTTTTSTPYYEPEEYSNNYEYPTKATKNYGFDVYGRTEDEDEDEELVRAAQEYYQYSENQQFGQKQRY